MKQLSLHAALIIFMAVAIQSCGSSPSATGSGGSYDGDGTDTGSTVKSVPIPGTEVVFKAKANVTGTTLHFRK